MTEEIKKLLRWRCGRIREIDAEIAELFKEHRRLYYEGLTMEQHNKLFDMVTQDGKSHYL